MIICDIIVTMMTTYQGPLDGFRGEVTRAAQKAIERNKNVCPACGARCPKQADRLEHATACSELRDDSAAGL